MGKAERGVQKASQIVEGREGPAPMVVEKPLRVDEVNMFDVVIGAGETSEVER